jgi:hypothetical protein
MTPTLPVCPLLSMRGGDGYELCLEDQCAFYVASAKKCSLFLLGYQALATLPKPQPPSK